jgi:peptide chain release factor 2
MADAAFWNDKGKAKETVDELKRLKATTDPWIDLDKGVGGAAELAELAESDADKKEVDKTVAELEKKGEHLEFQLMMSGPHDAKGAIVSCDWAQMLVRMYTRWAERSGFGIETIELVPNDEGGIKTASFAVRGPYAYGYLRSEIGVHRLVRISPFDAARRRHTSFASVSAMPEVEDVEVVVRDDEIRVDVFRSSGPGGQGVNTADSAVRITHLPTGIVVSCQNERSQLRNRDTALRVLRARLYQLAAEEQKAELEKLSGEKNPIAFGSQIRSYVFAPYQLIKDHRTNVEIGNVDAVMDGDIDPFVEAFLFGRGK